MDDPSGALRDAHLLVVEVMRERGYPTEDFEQRAADVSVDHPQVVQNYRAAHEITERGDADTEDQRRAMVHYRALFDELLETEPATGAAGRPGPGSGCGPRQSVGSGRRVAPGLGRSPRPGEQRER